MKKLLLLAFPIALAACADSATQPVAAGGSATAPGQNKLQCFDGTTDGGFGGTCTLTSNGAKGQATLSLPGTNTAGDYAGVYTLESSVYGSPLTDLKQVSYQYTATVTPMPGNISYNIPIDTDGNGTTDFYAFVDAYYCGGNAAGMVNITGSATCGVWAGGTTFYENWAAFVAAYPGAKVATDNYAFVIAERTPSEPAATYTLNNVKFGKAGS